MSRSSYCVIIPAYNAAASLGPLVRAVCAQGLDVIVVDDGSSDATGRIAKEQGAQVVPLQANCGKGIALRAGFRHAVDAGYAGVVTMDGDGQHNPQDLPLLLKSAEKSAAKVVVGNRMSEARAMPWVRRLTNQTMSRIISALIRQKVPDSQCGFRFIHREVLENTRLTATHYDIETELLLAAGRKGWSVVSEPIHTIYGGQESHIRPVRDTFRFLRLVARHVCSR
jgi:glycosyltransferase involved in cell wall biosynthesis